MPRQPRNPGSGKAPVNTPARGPGWGGAAKGDGNGSAAAPPVAGGGKPDAPRADDGTFALKPESEEAQAIAAEMLGRTVQIARNSEFEQTRLDAANKVMERVWGKPKQATEVSGKDGAPLFPTLNVTIARADG